MTPRPKGGAGPLRLLFLLFSAAAWIVAVLAGVELLARVPSAILAGIGEERVLREQETVRRADDAEFDAALNGPMQPPPGICREDPPRDRYESLDSAGRKTFADSRGELVVETDPHGTVMEAMVPTTPEEIHALGQGLAPGASVLPLLAPDERADLAQKLTGSDPPGGAQEYYANLPDGRRTCVETTLEISASGNRRIFLRLSRYEQRFESYRPLVCRRNWYGEDFDRSLFWTNARGFRDRETVLPKPAGTFRVVCLGGSTTVEGPHNALTYPKYLEQGLQARFGGDRVDVVNCGVDANAIGPTVANTRKWLSLQPDLLVHYNYVNDLSGVLNAATRRAFPPGSGKERWARALARSKAVRWAFPGLFMPPDADFEAEFRGQLLEPLAEMTRNARAAGVRVALCSFAHPDAAHVGWAQRSFFSNQFDLHAAARLDTAQYGHLTDLFNRCLKDMCRETGAVYVPVAENLTGGTDVFTDICHMHLAGIKRKAQIVLDSVAGLLEDRTTTP